METIDLRGKLFLKIEDSEYGGVKITFEDNTVAYYNVSTFPDGTVSNIYLDKIIMAGKK